jgi:hypothetical protein
VVMTSAVAHVVSLLKSHVSNLDPELLRCDSDAERGVLGCHI